MMKSQDAEKFPVSANSAFIWTEVLNKVTYSPEQKIKSTKTNLTKKLTIDILSTFKKCNKQFYYDPENNPRRALTFPSEGLLNNGWDNENNDYILRVKDKIVSPESIEYVIQELLGKGTFGQVVKCVVGKTTEECAVKVIKNKPNYTLQARTEVDIFQTVQLDVNSGQLIVQMKDYFVYRNHVCIVFELMSYSLLDVIKMTKFTGLALTLIQAFATQLLHGLVVLERNRIIHCDLKPENILLVSSKEHNIKIIDLGSSCLINNPVYTYIQSRFYRAPEVLLGMKYTQAIDIWSLGCIIAELYLGPPIFPGSSVYDQMKRIIDILGMPSDDIINKGIYKLKFFKQTATGFVFKTQEEYENDSKQKLEPHKKYFVLNKLEDLVSYFPKSRYREKSNEQQRMGMFIHFIKGLLNLDPEQRWTSAQALFHPYISGEPFNGDWTPPDRKECFIIQCLAFEKVSEMLLKSGQPITPNQYFYLQSNSNTIQNPNGQSHRQIFSKPWSGTNTTNMMTTANTVQLLNTQNQSNQPNQPTKERKKLNPKKEEFKPKSDSAPNSTKHSNSLGEKKYFTKNETKEEVKNDTFQTSLEQKLQNFNGRYNQQGQGFLATQDQNGLSSNNPNNMNNYMQKPRSYSQDYENPPGYGGHGASKGMSKEASKKKYISPYYQENDSWLPKIDSAMTNAESPQCDQPKGQDSNL